MVENRKFNLIVSKSLVIIAVMIAGCRDASNIDERSNSTAVSSSDSLAAASSVPLNAQNAAHNLPIAGPISPPGVGPGPGPAMHGRHQRTFANPIDLEYRFALDSPSRREAADPTVVVFNGAYYLFASKSGGYFRSSDLRNWELITTNDLPIEAYAPTAVEIDGWLYFMVSNWGAETTIHRTRDPATGKWELVNGAFPIVALDADLFLDDDGRVYLYYGCSNLVNPLHVVELDPKNSFNPMGEPIDIYTPNTLKHGWEQPGNSNELTADPWIEGSFMTKHEGRYYLQFAGPGTEFKSYADGVLVADKPTGPFTYADDNPVSQKPGGFIGAAGHGSTFKDRYGNYWHAATMSISVAHMFERRIGLFPAFFRDGQMHVQTAFGDFPTVIPDRHIANTAELISGWMLLSYGKPVRASSSLDGFPPENAVDEDIRTHFSALTGENEWLMVDLKKPMRIEAVQLNLAEHGSTSLGREGVLAASYVIEHSVDGRHFEILIDRSANKRDAPHDYVELEKPVTSRFVRVKCTRAGSGNFAVSDLRVFGQGPGRAPAKASGLSVIRDSNDLRKVSLSWNSVPGAVGYNIRYGIESNGLFHDHIVFGKTELELRSLDTGRDYFFTVDAFNEAGISRGTDIVKAQ